MSIFRISDESPYVYTNMVTLAQYKKISQKEGFMGELPSVIKSKQVINQGVIDLAERYESGSQAFLTEFLTATQNGKTLQRTLNEFGLRATRIDKKKVDRDWN